MTRTQTHANVFRILGEARLGGWVRDTRVPTKESAFRGFAVEVTIFVDRFCGSNRAVVASELDFWRYLREDPRREAFRGAGAFRANFSPKRALRYQCARSKIAC
jgi:hypothetical protein